MILLYRRSLGQNNETLKLKFMVKRVMANCYIEPIVWRGGFLLQLQLSGPRPWQARLWTAKLWLILFYLRLILASFLKAIEYFN